LELRPKRPAESYTAAFAAIVCTLPADIYSVLMKWNRAAKMPRLYWRQRITNAVAKRRISWGKNQ